MERPRISQRGKPPPSRTEKPLPGSRENYRAPNNQIGAADETRMKHGGIGIGSSCSHHFRDSSVALFERWTFPPPMRPRFQAITARLPQGLRLGAGSLLLHKLRSALA